tara:strand:+ start:1097 stop:1588 length:492 start_codon:yes stop_codon:yes gene_type:complete
MKICRDCGEEKPPEAYYTRPNGYTKPNCRACVSKHKKEYDNSPKGKEVISRYNSSQAHKDAKGRYRATDNGKATEKAYNQSAYGKAANIAKSKKQREQSPDKTAARHAVKNAVRNGSLVRPIICSVCSEAADRIEGHHWSYAEEHHLDVVWCCTPCHKTLHNN